MPPQVCSALVHSHQKQKEPAVRVPTGKKSGRFLIIIVRGATVNGFAMSVCLSRAPAPNPSCAILWGRRPLPVGEPVTYPVSFKGVPGGGRGVGARRRRQRAARKTAAVRPGPGPPLPLLGCHPPPGVGAPPRVPPPGTE